MAQVLDSEIDNGYALKANSDCLKGNATSASYVDYVKESKHELPFMPQINNKFTIYRPLAKGCNGQVSLGNYNGELVAIKEALCYQTISSLGKEVQALKDLQKHSDQYDRYVGALLAVDVHYCPTVTVYRFYANGNLENYLSQHPEIDFSKRLSLMIDLSCALKFIHGADILHKDLKAENILISDDGTLRISDFGCATHSSSKDVDFGGDLFTRSPKMLSNTRTFYYRKKSSDSNPAKDLENFSKADDIYSLGLVLYHIMTSQLPLKDFRSNTSLLSLYQYVVVEKQRPDISIIPKGNAALLTLLRHSWHDNEKLRPSIENLNQTLILCRGQTEPLKNISKLIN